MSYQKKFCLCFASFFLIFGILFAFEHHDSHVNFLEYNKYIIKKNKKQTKPYFLLFAAEWCHWCEIFAEETLTQKKIYTYLNKNFINIFIDADIHSGAYKKYKASGVPYTVFLNPDTSIYYKYSGALYAEPFLEVIEGVNQNIKKGVNVDGDEIMTFEYTPPTELKISSLKKLQKTFINGLLDNLDWKEYGFGNREKKILPETFLYFLKSSKGQNKKDAVLWSYETLLKAIEKIYDPIEGGFFRFAEKKDWDIPHYEKMAGLNAGIVLLLYRVDNLKPNDSFKKTAEQTIEYLSNTLYDQETGSFLSFQEADTSYYFFNKNRRKNLQFPNVIKNIYTTHLATTLNYFLDLLEYTNDNNFKNKIISSIDFLSQMISKNDRIYHYYSTTKKKWLGKGDLQDYALLAKLFHRASKFFKNENYQKIASKLMSISLLEYYNRDKLIFIDPELDDDDYEYLMKMNAIFAKILMENEYYKSNKIDISAKYLITYFSELDELLEDRLWDSKDWDFLENYATFLSAAAQYKEFLN